MYYKRPRRSEILPGEGDDCLKIICLSHPLNSDCPLYPGTPEPVVELFKSIERGDSANSSNFSTNVHTGTHIDLPLHFCKDGKSLSEHIMAEQLFYPAYCIDISKKGNEPLFPADFEYIKDKFCDAEAILVRTGAGISRENYDEYEQRHPWVHPSLSDFLRKVFPELKLFGLDAISIASPEHREEGREAHRRFLCGEAPIILLEDAKLSELPLSGIPFRLRIYPYFYDRLDASPVIALAETDQLPD